MSSDTSDNLSESTSHTSHYGDHQPHQSNTNQYGRGSPHQNQRSTHSLNKNNTNYTGHHSTSNTRSSSNRGQHNQYRARPNQPRTPPTASITSHGMQRSKRSWDSPPANTNVRDLPLVSRSDHDATGPSLKEPRLQRELWKTLHEELSNNPAHPKSKLVTDFRKLREGVRASHWCQGDTKFSVKVYETSILVSIRVNDMPEFWKALRILIDDLYPVYAKVIRGMLLSSDWRLFLLW
ncbi:hypothetical protein DM01DRAFT_1117747 [Hesseltinella vesiculosa]|uniref:Uncharacterized protein n=1 Tax=Hesseltinella vesiculosa TaxID=101127 RepID=A0A1X2G9R2_9FUNG|nr:hypothetical protein DM01DRAFT_1117747 [Hesseltinella vesiculosa]